MNHQPLLIFSHGNSFPASTYRVLFDSLRQRGFKVDAVEKFGHDPKYPVTNNWPHLVEQLADFARKKQGTGAPAFLVGHSLGGACALALASGDTDLLLSAIGDVAKARGMAQIARDTGLGRESLYKALSAGAKPRFDTVFKVLQALGVQMQAHPMPQQP